MLIYNIISHLNLLYISKFELLCFDLTVVQKQHFVFVVIFNPYRTTELIWFFLFRKFFVFTCCRSTDPGFIYCVAINPRVLSANRVDLTFLFCFINFSILPPPPQVPRQKLNRPSRSLQKLLRQPPSTPLPLLPLPKALPHLMPPSKPLPRPYLLSSPHRLLFRPLLPPL